MKKLLLTLIVLSSSLLAFSQGTWTPRDTLPDSAMAQGISGFSICRYGYAGLGNYNFGVGVFNHIWRFDPSTNKWAQMADFPGKARVAPASFVIGNKVYLVTGSVKNGGACLTECWEYDATNNTWTRKADFPGTARTYAVGFAIDSLGYVGTGANELSDFRKDFYAYHPSTDDWTRIADLPGIPRDGSSAFAVNGKGYICFGKDSNYIIYPDTWEYEPVGNTWSRKADNPVHMMGANGFVICDNIYVGGGDTTAGIGTYKGFWKYNTVTDVWTQMANVPGVKQSEGAAFSIGDTGYYGFGFDSNAAVHNVFEKFNAGDSCVVHLDSCNVDVGLKDVLNNNQNANIYPNPFNEECFVEMPDGMNRPITFSIFDIEGRKLNANITGSNMHYVIKRNGLPQGVFILAIKINNTVIYKKLAIIN